jgi:hypothetical protein
MPQLGVMAVIATVAALCVMPADGSESVRKKQDKYFLINMKGRVKHLLFRNQVDKHITLSEAPEMSKLITCK